MGLPREHGRMNASVKRRMALTSSFNGAAARTRQNADWAVGNRALSGVASMGLPREHGRMDRPRRTSAPARCFNGAAARTRQNENTHFATGRDAWGFNGAAARTRQKVPRIRGGATWLIGFNGAAARTRQNVDRVRESARRHLASMGLPREHGRMSLLRACPARATSLQWGCRANTAE